MHRAGAVEDGRGDRGDTERRSPADLADPLIADFGELGEKLCYFLVVPSACSIVVIPARRSLAGGVVGERQDGFAGST